MQILQMQRAVWFRLSSALFDGDCFRILWPVFFIPRTELSRSVWHLRVQLLAVLLKTGYNQPPELCPSLTLSSSSAEAWVEFITSSSTNGIHARRCGSLCVTLILTVFSLLNCIISFMWCGLRSWLFLAHGVLSQGQQWACVNFHFHVD